ncbi:MAG TPA: XdhC family protein [Gemmatimonadaceae bacterium]|nr:XdhC family protein [Gemmatimonadaceae bacterium]
MADLLEQLDQLRATERRVAMATLMSARGGSPRPIGSKLFVGEGGRLLGSVSIGGCIDAELVRMAEGVLEKNESTRVVLDVDDSDAQALGVACGAQFELLVDPIAFDGTSPLIPIYEEAVRRSRAGEEAYVVVPRDVTAPRQLSPAPVAAGGDVAFVDRFAPAETVVIVGASDTAAALVAMVRALGMRAVVIEGREQFAARREFATLGDIQLGMPSELVRPWLRPTTYLVMLTHDYKFEVPVLREALASDARYVGMLAGRKRAAGIRDLLRDAGLTDAQLARLHSPIGLDLGGREPAEIAVSILAQIVSVRAGRTADAG